MIRLQRHQHFAQRTRNRLDLRQFLRAGLEKIEFGRLARIDLVLDAIESGQQQGREEQVWVGSRIRAAELQALGLLTAAIGRDADGSGTVTSGVDEVDWRLDTREPGGDSC